MIAVLYIVGAILVLARIVAHLAVESGYLGKKPILAAADDELGEAGMWIVVSILSLLWPALLLAWLVRKGLPWLAWQAVPRKDKEELALRGLKGQL